MTPETNFYNEIAPSLDLGHSAYRILSAWPRLSELGLTAEDVVAASDNPTADNVLGTILRLYGEQRGKSLVGEKTPQHLWHVERIFRDFPDARIICIARDSRDVALSLTSMPWWSGDLNDAAAMWRDSERLRVLWAAAYPKQFLSISFADLVHAPEATLIQVMGFLHLSFQSSQLDPGRETGVVLDRSRQWKSKALQTIDPGEVGRQSRKAPSHILAELDALA